MKNILIITMLIFIGCDDESSTVQSSIVHGCLDSQAINYNPSANVDNNSCEYAVDDFAVIEELININELPITVSDFVTSFCYVTGVNGETRIERIDLNGSSSSNGYELLFLPESIGNLTYLIELNLSNHSITYFPESLMDIENLTNISCSQCEIMEIPSNINQLTNLVSLYLDNNNISSIPEVLGYLPNLVTINLRNNQLTGDIPQSVCNLIESNNLNIDYYILDGNNLNNTCE